MLKLPAIPVTIFLGIELSHVLHLTAHETLVMAFVGFIAGTAAIAAWEVYLSPNRPSDDQWTEADND